MRKLWRDISRLYKIFKNLLLIWMGFVVFPSAAPRVRFAIMFLFQSWFSKNNWLTTSFYKPYFFIEGGILSNLSSVSFRKMLQIIIWVRVADSKFRWWYLSIFNEAFCILFTNIQFCCNNNKVSLLFYSISGNNMIFFNK